MHVHLSMFTFLCSTALKRDAEVFRLKKDHKNLDTSDYAANLCQYLDQSRGVTNLSMGDLRNVLNGLNSISVPEHIPGSSGPVNEQTEEKPEESLDEVDVRQGENYHYGEHIACVWTDDVVDPMNWHMGVDGCC